jgi:hypothetical protein
MSEERYDAYIVRIWQDAAVWRAAVTHVATGRRQIFTSPSQLCSYWQEQHPAPPATPDLPQGDNLT